MCGQRVPMGKRSIAISMLHLHLTATGVNSVPYGRGFLGVMAQVKGRLEAVNSIAYGFVSLAPFSCLDNMSDFGSISLTQILRAVMRRGSCVFERFRTHRAPHSTLSFRFTVG
jgi:hypothetical protein